MVGANWRVAKGRQPIKGRAYHDQVTTRRMSERVSQATVNVLTSSVSPAVVAPLTPPGGIGNGAYLLADAGLMHRANLGLAR